MRGAMLYSGGTADGPGHAGRNRSARQRRCPMKGPGIALILTTALVLAGSRVQTQQRGGTAQTDKVPPVNSGANPYRVVRDWAQLQVPARPWGGSNGVAVDRDGKSVWATDRCSPGTAPS